MAGAPASIVLADLDKLQPDLAALYQDIHSRPELSMQVEALVAGALARLGRS